MRKRPLNSATLATATHKEMIRVSDRTSVQIEVWMISKCKVQMIGEGLCIEESPKRRGRKKRKEGIQEQNPAVRIYAHE